MQPNPWDIKSEKSPINPIVRSFESRQQEQQALEKTLKYHYPRHIPQPQPPSVNLAEEKVDSYTELEQRNLCPRLNYYQPATNTDTETTNLHLDNIRQNLEKRIKAAQSANNQELVKLLEQEWSELALNVIS